MVQLTQDETKQLAQSVDVDDMDASLFGSFQNQRKNSKPRNRSTKPSTIKKSELADDSKHKEPVTKQLEKERETPVGRQVDQKSGSAKSTESKKSKLGISEI